MSLIKHLLEKSPLRYQVVRCAESLDPNRIADQDEEEANMVKFKHLTSKLASVGVISATKANKAYDEYRMFMKNVVLRNREQFKEFHKYEDRLDEFYHKYAGSNDFSSMFEVCQIICVLFHGQAHIERGFKTNSDLLKDNLGAVTLVNLRTVHEFMSVNGYKPYNVPFTHDLIKNVRKARSRYGVFLEEERAKKMLDEKELKRKVVADEIDAVRKKKGVYEAVIKKNKDDADSLCLEAELKQDLRLLSQANSLRNANIEKIKLIDELKKMELDLIKRRDGIV